MGIIGKLGGKKFLAAIGGVICVLLVNKLGMSEVAANQIVNAIMAMIGGFIVVQGASDIATNGVTSSSTLPVDMVELQKVNHAIEVEKTAQSENRALEAGHDATVAIQNAKTAALTPIRLQQAPAVEQIVNVEAAPVKAAPQVDSIQDAINKN